MVGAVKWPSSSTTTQRGPGRMCPVSTSEAVVTWGRPTPGICGTRGTAPVATTTDSGSSLSTSDHIGRRVETDLDAGLLHLADQPVGDGRVVFALRRAGGDEDLAAERRRRLQQRHLVTAQRGHPRRFQTAHTAADHQHALRARDAGVITPSSASRPISGFWTQVIALPWRSRPMQPSLAPTQVRMSSSRPSMAFFGISGSAIMARVMPTMSHMPEASTRLRLLGRAHTSGEDHRHLHHRAGGRGQLGVERMRMVERGRDHGLEAQRLRVRPAHHPVVRDAQGVGQPRHLEQVFLGQPAGHEVIAAVPDADDEVLAHRVAHGVEHLVGEAEPVLDAAAVLVGARVGEGGEKVLDEVTAVEGNVAAVVAALLEPHRRRRPRVDDLADLPLGHDVGPLAVTLLAGVGRTPQRRARVPGVPAPAPVRDLGEAERAVTVDGVAHLLELGNDAVVPVVDLAPVVDRGGMDAGGAEHHHRAAAALGLLFVIADVAVGEAAALAVGGAVGGGHDAVLGHGVAEGDGAQEMPERSGHGYFSLAS